MQSWEIREPSDDLTRMRELFDGAADGMVATDPRGVVRLANARLARLLQVPVPFVVGKPFIHFVARGDCNAFRKALAALARADGHDVVALRLRARHGGSTFPAEARARVGPDGGQRQIVWTIRPWSDASAASVAAPAPLSDLLRASIEAVRGAGQVRKIALVEGARTDGTIAADRIAHTRVALDQLARTALHLASDGGEIRVTSESTADGAALVRFGDATARVRIA